mgnify:CR=1 FL=1
MSNHIEHIPLVPSTPIPVQEYIDLLCTVPAGKITRTDDIEAYFKRKYKADKVHIEYAPLTSNPLWEGVPYWRQVSSHGMLRDLRFICTREQQKEKLEQEGLSIVPCGAYGKSLKVENYKDLLFDYATINEQ